jgi:hypothetical protein
MLNYENKTGFEICKGSGSDRYVMLRRYNVETHEFETLFIARFKYNKPGTKASAYVKRLENDLGNALLHVTQEDLDEYRAIQNKRDSDSFGVKYEIEKKLERRISSRIVDEVHASYYGSAA